MRGLDVVSWISEDLVDLMPGLERDQLITVKINPLWRDKKEHHGVVHQARMSRQMETQIYSNS